jgi:50S ribosomal protein L16 3-hydroxylase
MPAPLGAIDVETFLAEYWQKQPCLIRQAFPDLDLDLDGDDLAGLACEPMAESRIVLGSYPAHDWELRHGPFTEADFAELPERQWTLLVQDVEKHYPPLLELLQPFGFLPAWRLDDLMVSYAAAGGSVGPHVDQYDVFLLQAEGQRRWEVAEQFDPTLLADTPLNVLRGFTAEHEWVLEPGDMLYLPPGIAHHGVALTDGMTCSIGLRAPDAADLLMALGEHLARGEAPRYADPDLAPGARAGEIDVAAIDRLKHLLEAALQEETGFRPFAGEFLTRFRLAQEPAPPDQPLTTEQLSAHLENDGRLFRNPWTRLAWIEDATGACLFAAGEPFDCSIDLAMQLCALRQPDVSLPGLDDRDRATLTALVNAGHLLV